MSIKSKYCGSQFIDEETEVTGIKELFKSHTAKQQLGIKLKFKCFKVNHKVMIKHNVYIYPESIKN